MQGLKRNMKKTYMKPAMQVVEIQQQGIICTSWGANSLNSEEFTLTDDLDEDDV